MELRPGLTSFIFRLTCHRDDAEDIVQDTFIAVQKNIASFEKRSSFKTWVYAIAINKTRNNARAKKKWQIDYQDRGEAAHIKSPALLAKLVKTYEAQHCDAFEVCEHINYCFNCTVKTLSMDQQVCIWLQDFYKFRVDEIALATDLSIAAVRHALAAGRRNLTAIFTERCAFVSKKGTCHQCTALKGILNPSAENAQKKVEKEFHKKSASKKSMLQLRIAMVKDINPLYENNSHLHSYMLAKLPDWAGKPLKKKR